MLQETPHIEGFEGTYEDSQMINDVPLGTVLIKFSVKSEEMPAKTFKEGHIVRENFVWIQKIMNLGNGILERRINDSVEYVDGKWKVKKFAEGMQDETTPTSDIRRYSKEWNSFARGTSEIISGTPLEFLFKNDPSKVAAYKSFHIHTIEQLEACSDANLEQLGMGGRDDREKAGRYLEHIKETSKDVALNNKFEVLEAAISAKDKQIADLSAKLTEVLTSQIEGANKTKVKPGRKPVKDDGEGDE